MNFKPIDGFRVQYRTHPDKAWKTARNKLLKTNPKYEYRYHPDDAQGFHIEGLSHWDGNLTYTSCNIYWRGRHLAYLPRTNGGTQFYLQMARDWFRANGFQFQYLIDLNCSTSHSALKRKTDL